MQKRGLCWLCYIGTAVLLLMCVVTFYNVNRSHTYKGNRLKFISAGEDGVVMADKNGGELILTTDSANVSSTHWPWDIIMGFDGTVRYLSETIKYSYNVETMSGTVVFSDGTSLDEDMITTYETSDLEQGQVLTSIDGTNFTLVQQTDITPVQREEKQLIDKLMSYMRNERPMGLYVGYTFAGLLMLLLGAGLLFYPEQFWKLQTLFTVRNGEPTDWALLCNRIAGVILIAGTYIVLFYITL